jgi:tRNA uridine 5-carboxymethylaminomethyl modification enzyme
LQEQVFGVALSRDQNAMELLRRPEVSYRALMTLPELGPGTESTEVAEQLEIQARYHGYIERQKAEIERASVHESTELPDSLDYAGVRGLSSEVSEKLQRYRPATLGQARRISGITPAAISLLMVHLRKHELARAAASQGAQSQTGT